MALIRWEPVRELNTIQSEMNRLFNSFFDSPTPSNGAALRRWIPAMDLVETDDDFVLRADLPGLTQDDVNIELEDNVLTISAVIAARGERQLHVAETEKYPHVTYFFNGGEETPYDGEERELVPSPRDVPTYDHKPQMSAPEAAQAFVDAWRREPPRFGIINFANADMVGHTGVIEAAVTAVETVDRCLGDVVQAVLETGGACLITADHGNADHMLEPDGSPNTAHSLNPVPVIVTVPDLELRSGGVLADVAPTLLEMMGIEQPAEMTGTSLISAG